SGVKDLFETALRVETGADASYYHEGSVAGRLRSGQIRSGDIYSLESWQEQVEVVEIRGADLSKALLEQLRSRGATIEEGKLYKVATTEHAATELQHKLGRIAVRRPGQMLRDLTVAYLRSYGFQKAQTAAGYRGFAPIPQIQPL